MCFDKAGGKRKRGAPMVCIKMLVKLLEQLRRCLLVQPHYRVENCDRLRTTSAELPDAEVGVATCMSGLILKTGASRHTKWKLQLRPNYKALTNLQ